jgi:predicted enzyme related to lactoylglutathione lyase
MSERDGYPAGVPSWVDTLQPDPDAATAFYGGLFGWEFEGPGEMPGHGRYLVARLRGRDVAGVGAQPSPDDPAAWNTYVTVDSADDAATKAEQAGGKVLVAPFDAPPAGRMAVLEDPTGAYICVWQAQDRKGAQLVNEPGAWSMSQLFTPDPDTAARFYGALFGWTTESFDMGDTTITMFRLRGYLGGEPEQPVSREVIATMLQSNDGPARWAVDFWVSDADAAVARATELGGTAIVPVFEHQVGRTAVLADAQGATFSISQVGGAR